jgi:hypothetical protein
MKALSEEQVNAWRRDGYLYPLPLLSDDELKDCRAGLARFEAWLGAPVNASKELKWRTMPHLILPWVSRLAHDPRILDCIEDLLGPDIMVFTSTFFIKDASTRTIADWHQDSTYYGLEPKEEVTVWVALTDASRDAGCMDVLPGALTQMPHAAHVVADSVNRAGQRITVPLDETRAVAMPLKAGQFSMHHGLCPHRSGPNTLSTRRIGLGLNFIPAGARPTGAHRTAGMLVRGSDRFGHFEPVSAPATELGEDAIAAHDLAVTRYRDTYHEQEALHERLSA